MTTNTSPPTRLHSFTALLLVALALVASVWLWLQWAALDAAWPFVTMALRLIGFALPLCGVSMGIAIAWRRYGTHTYIQAHHVTQLTRAQVQIAPLATSLTYQPQALPPAADMLQLAAPPTISRTLPDEVDLADLHCRPTPNHILLAVDELGQITVAVDQLCHVALLGATGGGKSNLLRLVLAQLQAIGASVILADPHFTPLDPENGDDWRPIADRLIHAPALTAAAIDQELSFMTDELARRLEKRNKGQPFGPPIFFAFDELPVICDLVKDAPGRMAKLLREGRKVHLLTVGASQSMLVKEVGGSTTARDQYRTAFYVGGDKKSAAAMLDMPERMIDDGLLGKGIVLLRSASTQPARLVRVPLVSNESLYQLLGNTRIAPTLPLPMGFRLPAPAPILAGALEGALEGATVHAPSSAPGSAALPTAEAARALALIQAGKTMSEVIKELFGVTSGRAYQEKTVWLMDVIRAALPKGA